MIARRAALAVALLGISLPTQAQLIGPTGGTGLSGEYARASDSPFAALSFSNFYLETFEDHLLNTPGVTENIGGVTSVVFGPDAHDSVDFDDATLDGSGSQGDSYFSSYGGDGLRFSFSAAVLGSLPTHAGLVWTDGSGEVTFEAFDQNGVSLGTTMVDIANGTFGGETNEDRFFGAVNAAGISAIFIKNAGGGIEVDHIQYGIAGRITPAIPEPETYALMLAGLGTLGLVARRRRKS